MALTFRFLTYYRSVIKLLLHFFWSYEGKCKMPLYLASMYGLAMFEQLLLVPCSKTGKIVCALLSRSFRSVYLGETLHKKIHDVPAD